MSNKKRKPVDMVKAMSTTAHFGSSHLPNEIFQTLKATYFYMFDEPIPTNHVSYGEVSRKVSEFRRENSHYDCIFYERKPFVRHMLALSRAWTINNGNRDPHFVDVGGGIGDKMFMAMVLARHGRLGKCSMIEYNPLYCKKARVLTNWLGGHRERIINEDALVVDYSPFDIVYMYDPMRDVGMMDKLWSRLLDTCKEGTMILNVGQRLYPDMWKYEKSLRTIPVSGDFDIAGLKALNNRRPVIFEDGRLVPMRLALVP